MKKFTKACLPVLLCTVMLFGIVSPAVASAIPAEKEEVVYINLNADGSISGVYVVNIIKGSGEFVDYGNYSAIRNMTTSDNLILDNGVVTGQTTAEKLYYEGTLENVQLPWDISVRYFLDGTEYSASDIAGQSGAFELRISIRQNPQCDSVFFDNYALQVSVTLDTRLCKSILADGATIANIGSNKQYTYTVLPGSEKDITITGDVTDFRMDSIAINGVRLNLSIEIDDEELLEQVNELVDGIIKIDDGAGELKDGATELKNAVRDDLLSGISSLQSGADTLDDGIGTLQKGIKNAQSGLNRLHESSGDLTSGSSQVKKALLDIQAALSSVSVTADKLSELTAASSQIKTGIDNLYEGITALQSNVGYAQYKAALSANGLDIDALIAGNHQAISELSALLSNLQQTISELPDDAPQKNQLQAQISQLSTVVALLDGNNTAIGGTEAYLNQLSAAVGTLYTGVGELRTKYTEFDAAINGLTDILAGLLVNVSDLKKGIDEIVTQYTKLDSGIKEYAGGVATLTSGYSQIIAGMSSLASGSKELSNGIGTLHSGTNDLYDGVAKLYDGTVELSGGTGEMREQTDEMDTKISDKIDGLLASVSGGGEAISFVSDSNINIQSVQFAIQTESIETEQPVIAAVVEEENLNTWQKLLHLFGIE